jgi:aspartyl-tRNA(Asn)/glutamyl-tRNA(Gln) amidotransferase subunit C
MISKETVRHIAKLARLRLSAQEEDTYTEQLGKILDYVAELQSVDTTGTQPAAHVLPVNNIMRDDQVQTRHSQDQILKEAPDVENNFFRVPKIGE